MSGGSFDYACQHADDTDVFEYLPQFRRMEQWLRDEQKHDAADEVLAFILDVETAKRRLHVRGKRIADLLHAVEWTASGDTTIDAVDYEWNKLIGASQPAP